jgi:hypothetical protein
MNFRMILDGEGDNTATSVNNLKTDFLQFWRVWNPDNLVQA